MKMNTKVTQVTHNIYTNPNNLDMNVNNC